MQQSKMNSSVQKQKQISKQIKQNRTQKFIEWLLIFSNIVIFFIYLIIKIIKILINRLLNNQNEQQNQNNSQTQHQCKQFNKDKSLSNYPQKKEIQGKENNIENKNKQTNFAQTTFEGKNDQDNQDYKVVNSNQYEISICNATLNNEDSRIIEESFNDNNQSIKKKKLQSAIYSQPPNNQEFKNNKTCSMILGTNQNTDSIHLSKGLAQTCSYTITYLDYCDCIQIQNDTTSINDYFVLSKFTVYKGGFDIRACQKQGKGRILQRQFDKDFNSSYFHYEGEFENDQITGSGKLFQKKSKLLQGEGEWVIIQKALNKQPQIAIKPRLTKIKICEVMDHMNGKSENPIPYRRVFQPNSNVGFHEQLLNLNDLQILKSNNGWLNSSIIDAYVEHLNYEDEVQYWTKIKEARKLHKRLQIIPSWLFSWFHKGQNKQNLTQFQEIFLQFEPINYRIWDIYRKIGFVINSSNEHWYYVRLDFETMEMIIQDSLRGREYDYAGTIDILQNLFKQIDEKIKFKVKVCQQCQQQRNGYDCGAFTCINAKNQAEGQSKDLHNARYIRNLLLDLIKFKE